MALNVILLAFTFFVIVTDDPPTTTEYGVFTLLLLATPAFTFFALARESEKKAARLAALLNVVLLGAVCAALLDQYPHAEDPGLVPYTALAVLTPILSVVAVFRGGAGLRPRSREAAGGVGP